MGSARQRPVVDRGRRVLLAWAVFGRGACAGRVDDARMARAQRIELTFLGSLQQVAGRGTLWLELPKGGTVATVLALLRERQPQFAGVAMQCLVDGVPAAPERALQPGDGLFLLPPQ